MSKIIFTPNISKPGGLGGISVGTTPVASGTVGCIFFQGAGNVVQQDAGLFWDNTNKRLGVGATPATTVRLDVRAQGALSTDIAFRIRNSANTLDFAQFNGDGTFHLSSAGLTLTDAFSRIADGRMFMAKSGSNFIELNPSTANRLYSPTYGWELAGRTTIQDGTKNWYYYQGTLQIGSGLVATGGTTSCIWMENGTTPTSNYTDRHWYYSADIVAGNAAPHFRTENGAIIKIYQETTSVAGATVSAVGGSNIQTNDTFDGYTLAQVVKALRNHGLLA